MSQDRRKKKIKREKFNGTAIDLPDWQEILDAAGDQIKDPKHKQTHAELALGAKRAFNPAKAGTPNDWVAVRNDQYEQMLHYAMAGGYREVPDTAEFPLPEVPPLEAVSEDPHDAADEAADGETEDFAGE
jgi:protein involved in temperature-dependent protein secretion